VVGLVDRSGGQQRVELGADATRRLRPRRGRDEQDREHRREQGNGRAPHGADAIAHRGADPVGQ
jgi:hypothetical protein